MNTNHREPEDRKLARRAKGLGKPLLLFDSVAPLPIGALLLTTDYVLFKYLAAGRASRSAYRRFDLKMRQAARAVVTDSFSKQISQLASTGKLQTIPVNATNGKQKAVILPWVEYSLTSRAVAIRSRSTFLEEALLEKGSI